MSEVRADMVATIRLVSVAVGAEVVQGDLLAVLTPIPFS